MNTDLAPAVRAAQRGDEEAFRLLYRSLQPGLLRYLTALVGADAEDVAAETWLQVVRGLDSFHGDGFRAWVITIARNRALDHLRQLRRHPTLPLPPELLDGLSSTADTADQAGEAIDTDAAIAMIAMLPRREAEAVLLRTVLGLDAESAGRILGRRAGAVRTAAHRGLRRLGRLLQQAEHTSPEQRAADPLDEQQPLPGPGDDVAQGRTARGRVWRERTSPADVGIGVPREPAGGAPQP